MAVFIIEFRHFYDTEFNPEQGSNYEQGKGERHVNEI